MRKVKFATEKFYHVFNRGVDKRTIFIEQKDYVRFYACLFSFNDINYSGGARGINVEDVFLSRNLVTAEKKPLVQVVSFCLIPNHFHFLLEQVEENGISIFMHRLMKGYARYFNTKYERTGPLFDGPFKAVPVTRDAHFEHLPRYIHLNILDHVEPRWREGAITNWDHAQKILDSYPWSSHPVYMGQPQPLPVINDATARGLFSSNGMYKEFLRQWSTREAEFMNKKIYS